MHELRPSSEEYLKWIYKLQKKIGNVRSIDLAVYMGYSRASVCIAVKKLQNEGYLIKGEDGILHLTDKGLEIGKKFFHLHQFLTDMLIEMGVDPEIALNDACQLEHVLSDISCQKLAEYFNNKKKNNSKE